MKRMFFATVAVLAMASIAHADYLGGKGDLVAFFSRAGGQTQHVEDYNDCMQRLGVKPESFVSPEGTYAVVRSVVLESLTASTQIRLRACGGKIQTE